MSDVSNLVNDVIGFLHGKTPASSIGADAEKILGDVQKGAGAVAAVAPLIPTIVADVADLVAEGTLLLASKGLDVPEYVAAGVTLQQLAVAAQAAVAALQQGYANYQTGTAVIAASPAKTVVPATVQV